MRMEMGRDAETGPRKLNQDAYKEAVKAQAQQHAESISKGPSSMSGGAGGSDGMWGQATGGGGEQHMSKHAKRRAKKKQKKIDEGHQQQHDDY